MCTGIYSVSQKIPPAACGFLTFFDRRLRILKHLFTHLLYVPIYAGLQIFIQLCHIKRDYLVHVICSKCPPSAKTHVFSETFAKVVDSFVDRYLWQVILDLLLL